MQRADNLQTIHVQHLPANEMWGLKGFCGIRELSGCLVQKRRIAVSGLNIPTYRSAGVLNTSTHKAAQLPNDKRLHLYFGLWDLGFRMGAVGEV